jgi:hypothetical protein
MERPLLLLRQNDKRCAEQKVKSPNLPSRGNQKTAASDAGVMHQRFATYSWSGGFVFTTRKLPV